MKRHLIGIGGVGMSALATALVRLGDEVTGADRTLGTPNVKFLETLGVKVYPDDGSGVDAATGEVIISTAIEETDVRRPKRPVRARHLVPETDERRRERAHPHPADADQVTLHRLTRASRASRRCRCRSRA